MAATLTTGCRSVMTAGTGSDDMTMIYGIRSDRCPRRRSWLMTGVTGVGGINMATALTAGCCSIMTTRTDTNDLRVVNSTGCNRCPGCREHCMARIAGIGGIDVTCTLTTGGGAVMAAKAVVHKTAVIRCGNS